jgi:hypothetical protein
MKLYAGSLCPDVTNAEFPYRLFASEEEVKKYFFNEFANDEVLQYEAKEHETEIQDYLQELWEEGWFEIFYYEIDKIKIDGEEYKLVP